LSLVRRAYAFVWAFAQLFYRHRQRRWRALVASDFRDLS